MAFFNSYSDDLGYESEGYNVFGRDEEESSNLFSGDEANLFATGMQEQSCSLPTLPQTPPGTPPPFDSFALENPYGSGGEDSHTQWGVAAPQGGRASDRRGAEAPSVSVPLVATSTEPPQPPPIAAATAAATVEAPTAVAVPPTGAPKKRNARKKRKAPVQVQAPCKKCALMQVRHNKELKDIQDKIIRPKQARLVEAQARITSLLKEVAAYGGGGGGGGLAPSADADLLLQLQQQLADIRRLEDAAKTQEAAVASAESDVRRTRLTNERLQAQLDVAQRHNTTLGEEAKSCHAILTKLLRRIS